MAIVEEDVRLELCKDWTGLYYSRRSSIPKRQVTLFQSSAVVFDVVWKRRRWAEGEENAVIVWGFLLSAFGICPGLAVHPSWIDFGAKSPQKIGIKVGPAPRSLGILMQVFDCSQLLVWFPLNLRSYASDF